MIYPRNGIHPNTASAWKNALLVKAAESTSQNSTMTYLVEFRHADDQMKAFLASIIGHGGKIAYSWAVGEHADIPLALQACEQAIAT